MELGNEFLIPVKPETFARAKKFLQDFFPGEVVVDSDQYFVIKNENRTELGITPDSSAPTEADYESGVWLSFSTDRFEETKTKLQSFEVAEVQGGDENAFFFHFPGGPVFKLIGSEK